MLSAVALIFATVLFCVLCLSVMSKSDIPVGHSTLDSIRQLFNPNGADMAQLLADRARPNQRLVRAFGITNTFVSPDPGIHRSFVSAATSLLTRANRLGWEHFRDLSTKSVEVELQGTLSSPGDKIDYSIFIQCVTLRIILVGLLGAQSSVGDFARDDILMAAHCINELWALSKNPAPIPDHLLPQLKDALRRMLPDLEAFPNPVDIVIPAWETFWRVVATTVAYSHDSQAITKLFSDFHLYPTDAVYRGVSSDEPPAPSLKHVVDEAMRLHPPSKHIGRVTLQSPFTNFPPFAVQVLDHYFPRIAYVKEYADVKSILVTPDIWGADATQFNPWRYGRDPQTINSRNMALSYIFGGGKVRCIGSKWAPIAAAVISSSVFHAVGSGEYSIQPGSSIGGRNGWDGWSVRRNK